MKRLHIGLVFIFLFSVLISHTSAAQISAAEIKSKLDSSSFTFVANTAIPSTGKVRQLTSPYDVQVKKNSIDSHLPYFGISRSAPISPQESGMIFTSSDFTYAVTQTDGKSWKVEIKFKDQREVRTFFFEIFDNATATLTATGNYRDAISYRGYVK